MLTMIGKVPIIRVAKGEINKTEDVVAKESSLTIILDDQEIATLRCSPANQEYLALGFLLSQNLINSIVLTSGRASSEMLRKIAQRDVPVVASISAPTESGIKLADERGITLLGFVREKRINIYTNNWRLLT